MKKLAMVLYFLVAGTWCTVDENANFQCDYATYSSCIFMCKQVMMNCVTCQAVFQSELDQQ